MSGFNGMRHYSIPSDRMARPGYISANLKGDPHHPAELTFVPLGGPAPRKRPRRRFDEIERLYQCGFNGCEKAYGTLNHLNAHVAMQKHGEKRLPAEFKDMRKAWRKKKRDHAAASFASGTAWGPQVQRGSISSSTDTEFDRRDSAASGYSTGFEYHRAGSFSYNPTFAWAPPPVPGNAESRPTTSSSTTSSVGAPGRFVHPADPMHPNGGGNVNPNGVRRPSGPTQLSMPTQVQMQGFRQNDDDHPTPTQQHPNPLFGRPGSSHQQMTNGGAGFSALTTPMPMVAGGQYAGQFAFQR